MLELSDAAEVLSYEEFFPFGSTSYKAVPSQTDVAKRYRYTGKEPDNKNGLYYYGARYYAAWLSRWTAADPVVGPGSRYDYASNNPVKLIDPDGRQTTTAPGGGSGGGAGWVDVPSGGVLGGLVHIVTLAVLQERLLFRFPPILSLAEYRTLEGGSKSRPGGDTTGEIDLAVLTPKIPTVNHWVTDVYELNPDDMSGQMRDSKVYSYQSENPALLQVLPHGSRPAGQSRRSSTRRHHRRPRPCRQE